MPSWTEGISSGNLGFTYTNGFLEEARLAQLEPAWGPDVTTRGEGQGEGGAQPRLPRPQALTCAAEGHGAHSGQVDSVSLVPREELQPQVTDADEEEGARGQEVACGETRVGQDAAGRGLPLTRLSRSAGSGVPSLPLPSLLREWDTLGV